MEQLALTVVGAVCALLGGVIQYYIDRANQLSDRRRELLIEAYGDFLTGVSLVALAATTSSDGKALIVRGKQKICAYAPSSVVSALGEFSAGSQRLSDEEAQISMLKLVSAMRRSVGEDARGLEGAIASTLFGTQR